MKHLAPPRRVRVPGIGEVTVRLLVRVGCGVTLVVLAFLLSMIPLWLAHHDATAAERELNEANRELGDEHLGAAHDSLEQAREHVAAAEGHLNGPMADLWSHLSFVGPAVDDGRHLVAALDQATRAASIGVDVIDDATKPGSRLIVGRSIDLHQVRSLAARARAIGPHLEAAQAQIRQVRADDPLVGSKIASLKERAMNQLDITRASYRQFRPLLTHLPAILGSRRPQTYLVTIMNPAEQRFSGGATLQMATLRFDNGTFTFGPSQSVADVDQAEPFLTWPPVPGNPFHPPGPRRLTAATFSPWWQVSGEELLRAWQAQTGQRCQGLIAVDLQALASLLQITGPMQVSGYGEIDADNLVKMLAGSYDQFSDPYVRRRLNNALVPTFQQKLLGEGSFIAKGRSLLQDAKSRHAAFYFRDPGAQHAFARAGFSGNLSKTRHDYLGVFSQNLNGSKADYWQVRHVNTQVTLRADGSAYESLSVSIQNPAPGRTTSVPDRKTGYTTGWLGTSLGVFFPVGTQLGAVKADGRRLTSSLEVPHTVARGVRNRPFVRHAWLLGPEESAQFTANYLVPHAAHRDSDGDLTYQLDLDPQDLVQPQTNRTSLTIPDGYHFGSLPSGWSRVNASTSTLWVPQLSQSSSWSLTIHRDR
jgi:hypothetical protein